MFARILVWTAPAIPAWELAFFSQLSLEFAIHIRGAITRGNAFTNFRVEPFAFRALRFSVQQ
jgi:hypothetical protein